MRAINTGEGNHENKPTQENSHQSMGLTPYSYPLYAQLLCVLYVSRTLLPDHMFKLAFYSDLNSCPPRASGHATSFKV